MFGGVVGQRKGIEEQKEGRKKKGKKDIEEHLVLDYAVDFHRAVSTS